MMFAIIGKITVWLLGLAAAFYVPSMLIMFLGRNREGIGSMMAGMVVGTWSAGLYVVVSLVFFAFT